ncbi:transcriptional regulator with XRE-family HTH domain [Sporomusaceae bacterium BoRhaA]|uniref:helix-turn-helix domain-containing protein n=1 Tax=Pelorhabdus rhamnosifermentans TaxID=2772457 RepID=UPI001C063FCB|nr:helix-turn-helix transcriptional regulator [Pelorhabdus rhamnosifermentans]MBU2702693.1 transcriptional regulator with XRE-family HTH domain [Pelorhabdus rhamnosifermentans]
MNIGLKIKALRNERGYTLKQVADAAGISVSFVSEIERGKRNPGLDNLHNIARALGVSSDFILAGTNSINQVGDKREFDKQFPNVVKILRRDGKKITPEKERLIARIIETAIEDE